MHLLDGSKCAVRSVVLVFSLGVLVADESKFFEFLIARHEDQRFDISEHTKFLSQILLGPPLGNFLNINIIDQLFLHIVRVLGIEVMSVKLSL